MNAQGSSADRTGNETFDGRREERCLDSEGLLQGQKEILIRHESEVYRLRVTRNGKLILQK